MNYADLLEDSGFNPSTAGACAQGWNLLRSLSFDLVVCDHDLGDGKGIDIIKKMEQEGINTPVIYLSAASTGLLEEVRRMPLVKQVLAKPVSKEELLESVKNYLEESEVDSYPKLINNEERRMLLGN
jgi:two-component system response regulator (stage 0 sporulation protein F)